MKRKPMRMAAADRTSAQLRQRLMLVEDDDLVRGALEILLGDQYDVDAAASAEEAMERFVGGRYDLLITDLRLPGHHGDQLARAVRGVDPHLPTMLITGEDLLPDDARLVGFDAWLQKPFFDLDQVIGRVENLLEVSRLRRAG